MRPDRWYVLAIVSSALFLITIDMTVLYTALPRLTHDLAASGSEKLWIVNAYALVVAGLLPGLGALGDRVGHRRMLLSGLAVFGAASLLAAFSPTPARLIGARVILGVGAAMMMPATLSMIRIAFSDKAERALALGIWSAVSSGGAALGPVLGGVLLEYFWWGSVFLVNVPVVAAALLAGRFFLPADSGNRRQPWSPAASLLAMAGLMGLTYAIKEASRPDPSLPAALAAGVIGGAALAAFFRSQRRSASPLIDFTLFRDRTFSLGVVSALTLSLVLVGVELALSQRFQLVLGLSPLNAALSILPIPLAAFVGGPLAGLALPRVGTRRLLFATILTAGCGLALLLQSKGNGPLVPSVGMALLGFGMGAGMSAASTAVMSSASAARAGMAASVEEVSYELGGALGIAVFGSLLSFVYAASLSLPQDAALAAAARDSLDAALLAAESLPHDAAASLVHTARASFDTAFTVVLAVAAALTFSLAGVLALPRRAAARVCRGAENPGR